MDEFILGVVSSLVATVLAVATGSLSSAKARRWLVSAVSRSSGLPVRKVFRHQSSANRTLRREIARARWVRVLTGRGNELTRDSFLPLWTEQARRLEFAQILLPDPAPVSDSWLARREADIRRLDPGVRDGLLADQVRANADYVRTAAHGRAGIDLRFYNLPNTHRVVITDRVAYLTLYSAAEHGRNSPCVLARRPSPVYDFAMLLFSTSWDSAATPAARTCSGAAVRSVRSPT